MIQKKYLCKDIDETKKAIGQIGEVLSSTPHKCAVVTFYEKGFDIGQIRSVIGELKDLGREELLVAGISVPLVAELMPEGTGILMNLVLTEKADIDVFTMPCEPGGEAEAAAKLRARLDETHNVRAVELLVSNMALNTTRIMEKSMEGHEDAVLFGTSTIRNLPTRLSFEENENALDGYKDLQKQFDELKASAESYKADSDRLREQEAKAKEQLIKEIVGDDEKGLEMFQKFSVEELEHMKNSKIITEPVKAVNGASVDTITDGDADDIPTEDKVDEYSAEYFAKWEKENTHW